MTMDSQSSGTKSGSNAMSLVVDQNLNIVWADAPALDYFGKDIIGRPCHAALYELEDPCDRCIVQECFSDRRSHADEFEKRVKGNHRRLFQRIARPAEFRPDGSVQFVKEIIEDITSTRIYEKVMRTVERQAATGSGRPFLNGLVVKLCRIFRADSVYVGIFDPDHAQVSTVAIAVRTRLAANFDYPLLSAPCSHLVHNALQSLPSGVDELFPQCDWMRERGIRGYLGVKLTDSRNKSFGLLSVLHTKPMVNAPLVETLMTLFARPAGFALEQLVNQRNLEEYRHLTAKSNDLLALLNRDFVYQVVNRSYADFHGVTVAKMIGQFMPAMVGMEVFDDVIRPLAEACLQGRQGRTQTWLLASDQSRRCLELAFYPHYEKGANRVQGLVLCARDITRSKKLEAGYRQAAKMEAIGLLAGGIVHDFNNILGAVVGYTDLALKVVEDQSEVAQYLEEIQRAGLRATELVKQILAFSRKNHEVHKPIQPKTILKEALGLLRATIPTNIAIHASLESDAHIMADSIHLHQIVINLCTNAQHAMKERGGTLNVELKDVLLGPAEVERYSGMRAGAHVQISFADNGHGIPPDILDKLFDPFFTTKQRGEGTGMGLTMVEGIVKSYHGRIDVRSEVGHGTTFDIFLPVIEAAATSDTIKEKGVAPGNGRNILLVDDDRSIAEITGKMLDNLGYNVHTETDSRCALERFGTNPKDFDLVLSDVTMPGMTGDVLAKKVLNLRPDMPVILMTGHSERVSRRSVMDLGVKKLIFKPLSMSKLATCVREALNAAEVSD